MNIMENKRVTAIAALMAIAFVGICYKGYERYSELKDTQAKIAQVNSKIESYTSSEIPPTAKNSEMVVQAANEVEQLASALSKDISKYVNFCMKGESGAETNSRAYKPAVTPVAFQNRLKELSAAIAEQAAGKCQLNNGAGDFGMTSLKNQAPKEVDAPYLNFLLSAINRAEQHIIAAGAPSIDRVYCAPLPEEEIGARRKPEFFPLSFEIAFTAARSEVIDPAKADTLSVLPQVFNKLVQDGDFFFIITGMAVSTPGNLPIFNNGSSAPEAEGSESNQESRSATLVTGSADERVNVHITLQVLYFTTDKL